MTIKNKLKGFNSRKKTGVPTTVGISILLAVLLVASVLTAVTIGSVDISVKDVYKILLNACFGIGEGSESFDGMAYDIVWYLRLPRLILAIAVGMALSVSGRSDAGHRQKSYGRPLYAGYFLRRIPWRNRRDTFWYGGIFRRKRCRSIRLCRRFFGSYIGRGPRGNGYAFQFGAAAAIRNGAQHHLFRFFKFYYLYCR